LHYRKIGNYRFVDPTGIVRVYIEEPITGWHTTNVGMARNEEERKHQERQMRDFNIALVLHPHHVIGKSSFGGDSLGVSRSIVVVIEELGRYALMERIPLAFPKSHGWAHEEDYSRIVYYTPRKR